LQLPLLTAEIQAELLQAVRTGRASIECSLDLGRSRTCVDASEDDWSWQGRRYPYIEPCRDHTVYFWDEGSFRPIARYTASLIKLVPTSWGPPTFEIDGIKMLPTARVSPYEDAQRKVELIRPRDKTILDTCGGLGYFAASCLHAGAGRVQSYEKNPDVLWLRSLNPWSPEGSGADDQRLRLEIADVSERIGTMASASFDAALHDPPRFGIAGELYSQVFYAELERVLKRGARLFHYTGTPNRLSRGRDLPNEVTNRLRRAGFKTELRLDGVLAVKVGRRR
jgi:uncharacterized protein